MGAWWNAFWDKWSREDLTLLMNFVSLVFTVLIPFALWWLGRKQAERDSLLVEKQTEILDRQDKIMRRQRRDSLLESITRSSDDKYLGNLWREIRESPEYEGEDRDLLLARFRTNPALALPGTSTGVKVQDDLTNVVASHYVDGFERRYAEGKRYLGLLDFIKEVKRCGAEIDVPRIVDLVTGPTAERQRPGHAFFRELVNILPEAASYLLYAVEDIHPRAPGGLRLNVLTGTLLAVKDAEMERRGSKLNAVEMEGLRNGVAEALASLLHRNVLSSFNQWELEGSTDRVSATVAWLIRAVGWVADADDHQAMRMIENLSFAIQSIPDRARDWGIDSADVVQGFEWIREKQPELWKMYGQSLESAATEVGSWKGNDGRND